MAVAWCPATRRPCDQPCVGSHCLRIGPRVLPPMRFRPCPKCGLDCEGQRVKARIAYVCEACGARFWAPAVIVEVAAEVVGERTRPLRRRGRRLS